jgi:SAM-dependent methyltransferase
MLVMRKLKLLLNPIKLKSKLINKFFPHHQTYDWEDRFEQFGEFAVFDTRHSPTEQSQFTEFQKKLFFPLLKSQLRGDEKTILDFGCGPGRFTADLAQLINGKAIGTDILKNFLDLAPKNANTQYILSKNFFIEHDLTFDIIWICCTLGGFKERDFIKQAKLIQQKLNPEGLLYLVEATSASKTEGYWRQRTVSQIKNAFSKIHLEEKSSYQDLGIEYTIFIGRKIKEP